MLKKIRSLLHPLRHTVFHPQWLATRQGTMETLLAPISTTGAGQRVLDVGCATAWPRSLLPEDVEYIGLDYPPTVTEWYGSIPDVFGDAVKLPFGDAQFDAVMLFDVLEHLQQPLQALQEIRRVLRPGGLLLMNTPCMYPLHDEPRDYQRWTRHGHMELANIAGFEVQELDAFGSPLTTAFLLMNIAFAKTCLNGIRKRRPSALLLPVLPFVVVLNNVMAWLLGFLETPDDMMPISYRAQWRRPRQTGVDQ